MDFLRECATRLDEGGAADDVLRAMRERYTTVRCMNVKTCLVRKLCRPCPRYTAAIERGDDAGDLPPRLPANVRALRVSREEMIQCKRLGARAALEKNRTRARVDGRAVLSHARLVARAAASSPLPDLVFALMVLTGRRTCELLNGRSQLREDPSLSASPHHALFEGQAKKRRGAATAIAAAAPPPLRVPVLDRVPVVARALDRVKELQAYEVLDNRATSVRYQRTLSRHLRAHPIWKQAGRVHALRGVYTCMALRLFEWEASDAYVAMSILGHAGLSESLVYTPFSLGSSFVDEPPLGDGPLDTAAEDRPDSED